VVKKLTKHGNSLAIVIDRPILEMLKINPETLLDVSTDGKQLIIAPAKPSARRATFEAAQELAIRDTGGSSGSLPAMAATYLFICAQNHAFIDGNKRVGANAAITFLLLNDWEPLFREDELVGLGLGRRVRTTVYPTRRETILEIPRRG
jgi:antitoxin MazE